MQSFRKADELAPILRASKLDKDTLKFAVQFISYFGGEEDYKPIGSSDVDAYASMMGTFKNSAHDELTARAFIENVRSSIATELPDAA